MRMFHTLGESREEYEQGDVGHGGAIDDDEEEDRGPLGLSLGLGLTRRGEGASEDGSRTSGEPPTYSAMEDAEEGAVRDFGVEGDEEMVDTDDSESVDFQVGALLGKAVGLENTRNPTSNPNSDPNLSPSPNPHPKTNRSPNHKPHGHPDSRSAKALGQNWTRTRRCKAQHEVQVKVVPLSSTVD